MTLDKTNTTVEFYRVNFQPDFAVLVLKGQNHLFPSGITMADPSVVSFSPNDYDDGIDLLSVSDRVWNDADRTAARNWQPFGGRDGVHDILLAAAQQIVERHPELTR